MANDFVIKVPASAANLGCGYDVLGLALSIWLELQVSVKASPTGAKLNCTVTCEGHGAQGIPSDPERNMITKTALNVLRCHGIYEFPPNTTVHVINRIPLGRGLGSSGSAICAGVMLADSVAGLAMTKDRMMEFCLVEENHPDNIGASLFGGFIGSFLDKIPAAVPEDSGRKGGDEASIPGQTSSREKEAVHPQYRAIWTKYNWSPSIKIIAVIPDYEVKPASARAVLPPSYEKEDIIFNLQRVALLPHLLGSLVLKPLDIYRAMQDRLHQQHRCGLVHGLDQLLKLDPASTPGLLGICLSGAGPTILALATENFEQIAEKMIEVITQASGNEIKCEWKLLEPAFEGAVVQRPAARLSWLASLSDGLSRTIRTKG